MAIHIDPAYVRGANKENVTGDKADVVLLTHAHMDHCDPNAVKDFSRSDAAIIGPASCAKKCPERFRAVSPGDEIACGPAKIKAVDAYTSGVIRHFFHGKGACVGYLISVEGKTVYHAGDTDLIPEMASLGPVDVALLPVSGRVTMDIDDAVKATLAIKPKIAVPMHQNRADPAVFKEKMASAAPAIKVVLMKAGDELSL
jgi:L-ascorbate metabolism protein UlaG (beta-lactamase superfamily)